MHHGEGMGGDCALSHRVSCASWVCMLTINQTVSPCFCMLVAHDVYWCALQYVYGISKPLTMKCSSIFGKWCQGFCPSAVQLQHSPSLCPCHTGVISYSVVFMSLQICHLKCVLLNLISYCKPTTMCECHFHTIIEGSFNVPKGVWGWQMGSHIKLSIFQESTELAIHGWREKAKERQKKRKLNHHSESSPIRKIFGLSSRSRCHNSQLQDSVKLSQGESHTTPSVPSGDVDSHHQHTEDIRAQEWPSGKVSILSAFVKHQPPHNFLQHLDYT